MVREFAEEGAPMAVHRELRGGERSCERQRRQAGADDGAAVPTSRGRRERQQLCGGCDAPRVQFSEVSITLGGVHRLSEESKEEARLPKMPEDVDELSTTARKTSTCESRV